MNYQFCVRTDTGLLRDNNEDSLLVDQASGLAVLADGMGGYNAGEVASSMTTRQIQQEMAPWLAETGQQVAAREIRRALEACVDNVNRTIFEAARDNEQYSGMGTTLVVGVFQPFRLVLGHIGDSRCYRWRDELLTQLTRDHSLLQEQIDAGLVTPEQAAFAPNRNLVTRALGVVDAVALDLAEHRVEPGDVFLMCSDGLSDMLSGGEIARVLAMDATLEQKADHLVDEANANGGRDNISVLLAQAGSEPRRRSLLDRLLGRSGVPNP
jgi:protein phosphatase